MPNKEMKPEKFVARVLLDLINDESLCKAEIVATLKRWTKDGWNRRIQDKQ